MHPEVRLRMSTELAELLLRMTFLSVAQCETVNDFGA